MTRCRKCGVPKTAGNCCQFSAEEEEFKKDIKAQYYELAAGHSSKIGLASFIWRKFIDAKTGEQQAWNEKQNVIASMASNYENKYKPIIDEKDKEIEYLQNLVSRFQGMLPESDKESSSSTIACSGCGSTTGCYCR
ncbi:hypothetical protein [Kistimonas asteriae]|uniref:hypothetical protein n=1 Tax=Kistimonas asteriae TaxID=517724 RepID=UPI001BAAA957|nr:hypothetical protein [Kistimonas asteriae]